jgi:H+/Cl- antiporter ClcA
MIREHITEQVAIFLSVSKWIILSSIVGVMIGAIMTLFLKILQIAEEAQSSMSFSYYYLLPFALLITVWAIRNFSPNAEGHGTEKVIEAVHKVDGKIDISVIPIKVFATVLTIFSGGSVGKEGPGAQIGAGAASWLSDLLNFNARDRKKLVICGISAGFASVFGTPIAGAIFGVEVLIIGIIMYDILLPSFIAGFAAFTTAQFLGIDYTYYDLHFYQNLSLDFPLILKVAGAGIFFGFVSAFIIISVTWSHKAIKKLPFHPYAKAFVGGVVIVILTLFLGEHYIGLGLDTIKNTLSSDSTLSEELPWYAFLLKTLFTSLTLGSGGSGGIITPLFYIGATSGHTFGTLFSPEHISLFAALGFVSILSAATNAPIAATIMAVELFGIEIAHYAALSAIISFLISGHRSVFPSQILAMKKSELLTVKIGNEIEHTKVNLRDEEAIKIIKLRKKFEKRRKELIGQL